MKIKGKFSSKLLKEYPIKIPVYGFLGAKNADFDLRDGGNLFLFLKELPTFKTVFDTFIKRPIFFPFFTKRLDICLTLFCKPYFNEFYNEVKNCYKKISFLKKKYLMKYMLGYFGSDIHYKIVVIDDMVTEKDLKEFFIETDIHNKCKELIELLK